LEAWKWSCGTQDLPEVSIRSITEGSQLLFSQWVAVVLKLSGLPEVSFRSVA
jgi:hypothetical protein